jgi:hypothetical protein
MIYSQAKESVEHKQLLDAIEATGEDAPCSNFPDAYFVEKTDPGADHARKIAITLCGTCQVKTLCQTYAIRWQPGYGIYGGLVPHERRRERKRLIALGVEMPNLQIENQPSGYTHREKPEELEQEFDEE